MAIEHSTSQDVTVERTVVATTRVDRTYRAIIEAPLVGPFNILVYRENVLRDSDGELLRKTPIAAPVQRIAVAIATQTVTLSGGAEVSAATIMEALPLFFDQWTDEDIAAGRR